MKFHKVSKPKCDPTAVPLIPSDPAHVQQTLQEVQLAIARRAHELFEARGREHGHDCEDWFRARSELVCPVSVSMSESEDRTILRVDVVGFDETELEVSVEPSRVMIMGKKKTRGTKAEGGTIEKRSSPPDRVLEVIDLATEVMPEHAVVKLQAGVLKFELPAAARQKVETAVTAA